MATLIESNARSWKYFAEQINGAWHKGAGAFLEVGQYLIQAKEELDRDEYNSLIRLRLEFDTSTAKKMICIAGNRWLGAHVHLLPPCWSTLYELSKLEYEALCAAMGDGRINPKMMRKDAIALRKPKSGTTEKPPGNMAVENNSAAPPDPYAPATLKELPVAERARVIAGLRLTPEDVPSTVAALIVQHVTPADVPPTIAALIVQHAVSQERYSAEAQQRRLQKFVEQVRFAVATNEAPARQVGNIKAAVEAYDDEVTRTLHWCDRIDREASSRPEQVTRRSIP
ncbi:MAG TPA: hypothetical protein VGY99_30720 [Candidatus Binataceae bacterium]|jgi:hypothetical protein|nr:hypothetical protein [Candidatus Binataceae bacterium]